MRKWMIRCRQTHLNDHRSDFEKKSENKIAQLEPGSMKVSSMAEFRIRSEVQTADKNWRDWMENENKIRTGEIKSLHYMVNHLEQEMPTLKNTTSDLMVVWCVPCNTPTTRLQHTLGLHLHARQHGWTLHGSASVY